MTQTLTRTWSEQQQAIFGWFRTPATDEVSHLVVRARAGTGKTTTIIEAVRYAPEQKILLCAFNKRIAEELNARLRESNPKAEAKTLHAVGLAIVKKYWTNVRVNFSNERADALAQQVCGSKVPDAIIRLVSKLHSKGREIAPHAKEAGDLIDIALNFECEPDEEWAMQGYDLAFVEQKALEAMELAATVKPVTTGIDGSDMIFLPVRNGWLFPAYDLVVVDEAQDMTVAQLEIARGICRGRIAVVGDDRQAIYGFRGADSGSLDRLKMELNAVELGLNVTYRCGQAIVDLAAELVADFTAGPNNPAGAIEALTYEKLVPTVSNGDFVLSRVNAPLVSIAMGLLRNGKRARIAGRDIGAGLKALVRKLATGTAKNSIPQFVAKVGTWEAREVARLEPSLKTVKNPATVEAKIEALRDQAAMLVELADGAASVNDIANRIDALFTDDGLGQAGVITCSSVHRSKGLEANRVFVLAETIRRTTIEEQNIAYVAITRAKSTLVWVAGKNGGGQA
jgi:superfamily I DNA/RNA helicase